MKEQFKKAGYVIPETGIDTEKNLQDLVVRFDIAPVPADEEHDHKDEYQCECVRVRRSAEYGEIVSAIINDHYSSDQMQAIINNHLLDASEEHEAELQAMQLWRAKAKQIARIVVSL